MKFHVCTLFAFENMSPEIFAHACVNLKEKGGKWGKYYHLCAIFSHRVFHRNCGKPLQFFENAVENSVETV